MSNFLSRFIEFMWFMAIATGIGVAFRHFGVGFDFAGAVAGMALWRAIDASRRIPGSGK